METMYFILGMLSIVGTAFVVVTVWGIVKIVKLSKQIKVIQTELNESLQSIWRVREDDTRYHREKDQTLDMHLNKRFEEFERMLNNEVKDINLRIEDVHRRIDKAYQQLYQTIDDNDLNSVTQSKSYTDSRIDKLIDTYFEIKGLTSKKQVIKG